MTAATSCDPIIKLTKGCHQLYQYFYHSDQLCIFLKVDKGLQATKKVRINELPSCKAGNQSKLKTIGLCKLRKDRPVKSPE